MTDITKATPPQSPDGFTFDLQRFATDTWDGTAGTVPDAVEGVITITTAEQLAALAKNVNDDGNTYSGVTIKLGVDIDLSGHNWTPIGTEDNQFSGTFDGDSHIISNLKISNGGNNVGLFGYNGGTIKKVTLNNVDVTGNDYVGGLVGYNYEGTIENCTVSGTVSGSTNIGGLVGENYDGTVSNNTVVATVNGRRYIGGLVGWNTSGGTVTGNKFYSNKDAVGSGSGTVESNTRLYKLTVPNGVEYTVTGGNTTVINGTTYYKDNPTVTITSTLKDGYVYSTGNSFTISANTTVTRIPNSANHYVFGNATDGYTLATANNVGSYPDLIQVYALTLPEGVSVNSGTFATDSDGKYYATGNITFTGVKTGYVINGVKIDKATTISATLDTANHYALSTTDGYTLATTTNTTDYPELVQVYALNLPEGVSVSGDKVVTVDGTTYATGEVTLSATDTSKILQNITVNGTPDDDGVFTVMADITIEADIVSSLVFNKAGTGVEVGGKTGDFSANSGVYSITASQQNSTLTANDKNNTVIIAGGSENILTGGGGNDNYNFKSGGGIVTDYGIGSTKDSTGKALSTPLGTDVIKLTGKVTGVYFDRAATSKNDATFTAVVAYDNTGDGSADEVIVLRNVNKKPTKYGSNPVYQTNDVAAATLKIWDTSGSKQAVLSATKLKGLFKDDEALADDLSETLQTRLVSFNSTESLKLPVVDTLSQTAQASFGGDDNGNNG